MGKESTTDGYLIVTSFPDTSPIKVGAAAFQVFNILGDATGMNVDRWTIPAPLQQQQLGTWPPEDESQARYWATDAAYWRLCKKTAKGTVFQRISIGFHKPVTGAEKNEHHEGTPLVAGLDKDWLVSRITVVSALNQTPEHAPTAALKRERDDDILSKKTAQQPGTTVRHDSGYDDALRAKAALLDLMRSDKSPFEGADPQRFESLRVQKKGQEKYTWGAFRIDVQRRIFTANVDMGECVQFYTGTFTVDQTGRWIAEGHLQAHGRKPIERRRN